MPVKVRRVTVAIFAELIGRTPRRVQQLIQEGMPHRAEGAKTAIVPSEAIGWLLERAKASAAGADAAASDVEMKQRDRALRLELLELDVAERKRELVDATAAREFAEQLVGAFAGVAAGQLQQFERDMVTCATAAEARRVRDRMQAALMGGVLEAAREYAERSGETAAVPTDDAGSGAAA